MEHKENAHIAPMVTFAWKIKLPSGKFEISAFKLNIPTAQMLICTSVIGHVVIRCSNF